jgi:glycerol-3-phosphate dehydrogenase
MIDTPVVILGAGITGAGAARDLALRGIPVVVVDVGRPGRGTTAASTHLIHGGLRYLLYDRLTTHATCWDSGHIVRAARPLLTRLPILWPLYAGHRHGRITVEALVASYDKLQVMKEGRPHLRVNAETVRALFPAIAPEGLQGGVLFDEWWVDPVKLVEANLESARRRGARVVTEVGGVELEKESGRVTAVRWTGPEGRPEKVSAAVVVNAAGPWGAEVADRAGARLELTLRKGSHLVYAGTPACLAGSPRPMGLLLEAEDRERYVFVIPAGGMTLVGPTDMDTFSPAGELRVEDEEVRCLLASARRYFPDFPDRFDGTMVGARPLLKQTGASRLLSREYAVVDHATQDGVSGFVTITGGKMSDYRLMGEALGDHVAALLGIHRPSVSHRETLAGALVPPPPEYPRPSPELRAILRTRPRLRQAHALGHLALSLGRVLLRPRGDSSLEEVKAHYGVTGVPGLSLGEGHP